MKIKISVTHPIRVDWLTVSTLGRIGLTFAPGKHGYSKFDNGRWERDLAADLDRLVAVHGIKVLVCLLEHRELTQLGIPTLVEDARARGITVHRLPIPDGRVLSDLDPVLAMVNTIRASATRRENVVVHCMGGLGRAGTIGACVLVADGKSAADALADVARARGSNAPETDEQKDFVRRFAEYRSERC